MCEVDIAQVLQKKSRLEDELAQARQNLEVLRAEASETAPAPPPPSACQRRSGATPSGGCKVEDGEGRCKVQSGDDRGRQIASGTPRSSEGERSFEAWAVKTGGSQRRCRREAQMCRTSHPMRVRARYGMRGVRVGEASHPGPLSKRQRILRSRALQQSWASSGESSEDETPSRDTVGQSTFRRSAGPPRQTQVRWTAFLKDRQNFLTSQWTTRTARMLVKSVMRCLVSPVCTVGGSQCWRKRTQWNRVFHQCQAVH